MEDKHFNLQKLKYERLSRNISAEKVGDALGISANAYYKKESGSSNISVEEFGVILDTLGIPEKNAGIFFTFNVPEWEQPSEEGVN
jgi:transcriptional regulator with XRE-family HTH domain